MSDSVETGSFSKDDFSIYFKEVLPPSEEKYNKKKETFVTLEDIAMNDEESYKNLRSLLEKSGVPEEKLNIIDIERREKREELNILTTEEKIETSPLEHNNLMESKAEKIITEGICENFGVSIDSDSVLSGIVDDKADYNVIIVDPAYDAFQGYKDEYLGSDISLEIYKRFTLYGKKHRIGRIFPGNAVYNLDTPNLIPKIKGLIHTIGPGPSLRFLDFYRVLDQTIKSIADIVKGLRQENRIDENTEIRLPLISASAIAGGLNSQDKVNVYFPKLIESIRKHFSEPITEETTECKLINPVILFIPDEENFLFFQKYKQNLGIQECWVYDFDGVVHDIVTEDNNLALREKNFQDEWEVLVDNLIKSTLDDMRTAGEFARIKILSGSDAIFKDSIFVLLQDQGVKIDINDIHMGVRGKQQFMQMLIVERGIKVYKFVDDDLYNIKTTFNMFHSGKLKTLRLLYWVTPEKEYYQIDLFAKELKDFRSIKSREKLGNRVGEDFPKKCYQLLECYDIGYEFPIWSIEEITLKYPTLLEKSKVYYDTGDELDIVKRIAREREPVNIGGGRYYKKQLLKEFFGYEIGYYDKYFFENNNSLAPNIAVFTETPVKYAKKIYTNVKIINSIGYAFDSEIQVDYKYFFGDGFEENKKEELYERYKDVFNKIFRCACDQRCNTIVMSFVGGGNFALLYPNEINPGEFPNLTFMGEIFAPAFEEVRESYNKNMEKVKFNILFMGGNDPKIFTLSGFSEKYEDIGYFPQNIEKVRDLDKTLFVNAWDMLSVPGNGNSKDNSLDGYIGRNSAVAILGTPLTNPKLKSNDANYRETPREGDNNFATGCDIPGFPEIKEGEEDEIGQNLENRPFICENFYTAFPRGLFQDFNETGRNNWVIIDPAGSAFSPGSTTFQGRGLSGIIYNKFGMTDQTHGLGNLKAGQSAISNFNFEGSINAMIHAVGPDGRNGGCTPEIFYEKLDDCISNIASNLSILQSRGNINDQTQIRIPMISSAIYGGSIASAGDYQLYFDKLTGFIKNYICSALPNNKIVFCLYKQDDTTPTILDKFNDFYDDKSREEEEQQDQQDQQDLNQVVSSKKKTIRELLKQVRDEDKPPDAEGKLAGNNVVLLQNLLNNLSSKTIQQPQTSATRTITISEAFSNCDVDAGTTFQVYTNASDGNCLFRAVSQAITDKDNNSPDENALQAQLRQETVNQLRGENILPLDYLNKLGRNGTWATDSDIGGLARARKINFCIYDTNVPDSTMSWSEVVGSNDQGTAKYFIYATSSHYEYMKKIDSQNQQPDDNMGSPIKINTKKYTYLSPTSKVSKSRLKRKSNIKRMKKIKE